MADVYIYCERIIGKCYYTSFQEQIRWRFWQSQLLVKRAKAFNASQQGNLRIHYRHLIWLETKTYVHSCI